MIEERIRITLSLTENLMKGMTPTRIEFGSVPLPFQWIIRVEDVDVEKPRGIVVILESGSKEVVDAFRVASYENVLTISCGSLGKKAVPPDTSLTVTTIVRGEVLISCDESVWNVVIDDPQWDTRDPKLRPALCGARHLVGVAEINGRWLAEDDLVTNN